MDPIKETQSLLQEKLQPFTMLQQSHISKDDALQHINHYRQSLPPGSIKSVWLDRDIIDFIAQNADTLGINGLRVYMARYKEGYPPVTQDPGRKDKLTVIVVPTTDGTTMDLTDDTDLTDGYFDYGRPCPPTCTGDAGNP
jgi:hypothetical protein